MITISLPIQCLIQRCDYNNGQTEQENPQFHFQCSYFYHLQTLTEPKFLLPKKGRLQ